jgi:hypothetical protein
MSYRLCIEIYREYISLLGLIIIIIIIGLWKFCVVICFLFFLSKKKTNSKFSFFSFLAFLLLPPYFWVIEVTIVLRLLTCHTGSLSLSLSLWQLSAFRAGSLFFRFCRVQLNSERKKQKKRAPVAIAACNFIFVCLFLFRKIRVQ